MHTEAPKSMIMLYLVAVLEQQWGESIDKIRIFLKRLDTIPSLIGTLNITCWSSMDKIFNQMIP
jgi:hypothetical protein